MRLRSGFRLIKLPIFFLLMMAISSQAWSQTANLPSRTECKQWDDAYLGKFWAFLGLTLLLIGVLNVILPPLLGRFYWWATSPRWRILWITLGVLLLGIFVVIVLPQALGFGWLLFSDIGARYPECANVTQFDAEGLLFGLVGRNVVAVALWPYMLLFFLIGTLITSGIVFWMSAAYVRYFGSYTRVKGVD
jgi:hypothetical protein